MRRAFAPVPASGGSAQGSRSGGYVCSSLMPSWFGRRGDSPPPPASKLLARRDPFGRAPPRPTVAPTKLTARPRRVKPVDARFDFLKSRVSGTADRLEVAISSGDEGEGGELERVVLEDWLLEKRRLLLLGRVLLRSVFGWPSSTALPSVSIPKSLPKFELDRRKKLDRVRLKLLLEPRVERRDSVARGSGSAALLGDAADATLVFALGVIGRLEAGSGAGFEVGLEVGLERGLEVGWAVFELAGGVGAWEVIRGGLLGVAGG